MAEELTPGTAAAPRHGPNADGQTTELPDGVSGGEDATASNIGSRLAGVQGAAARGDANQGYASRGDADCSASTSWSRDPEPLLDSVFAIRTREHYEVQDVLHGASMVAELRLTPRSPGGFEVAALGSYFFGFVGSDAQCWRGSYEEPLVAEIQEPWRAALGLLTALFHAGRDNASVADFYGTLPHVCMRFVRWEGVICIVEIVWSMS